MESRFSATSNLFVPLLQFGSENQQLEWAKQASEREEQERLRRLQLQEQQDLELAIALSKAHMSGSWADGSSHLRSCPCSSQPCSWLQHQRWPDIMKRPRYQFVCKTSDSPAVTGHMLNDSTFSSKLRFKAHWTTQQLYNHGQYGATWFGPGFILQKPQLFNTNQTCSSSSMRLIAACFWLCHQETLSEKLFWRRYSLNMLKQYIWNESKSSNADPFLGLHIN